MNTSQDQKTPFTQGIFKKPNGCSGLRGYPMRLMSIVGQIHQQALLQTVQMNLLFTSILIQSSWRRHAETKGHVSTTINNNGINTYSGLGHMPSRLSPSTLPTHPKVKQTSLTKSVTTALLQRLAYVHNFP